jgi:hypothetical protein
MSVSERRRKGGGAKVILCDSLRRRSLCGQRIIALIQLQSDLMQSDLIQEGDSNASFGN